ncbi:MAG: HRDC domain-containing protein [Chloroflexota bacterium]
MEAGALPEPVLVTQAGSLKLLADQLDGETVVAVDTESNSLYAYREQVCLIQFSTRETDYLVDPLALEDLSPLAGVFANPKIEKVFHAAEYDVICLRRDFDFEFANLFDTMLAARILGRQEVGLGAVLQAEFNVHLEKRYQRANWGQRPLPGYLLDYARLDTHYLIALRERLGADLRQCKLWPLAQEDFERLRVLQAAESNGRAPDCWRIRGSYDLSPQQAAVLQEVCRYRERVASAQNRPLFKVISDQSLLAIAGQGPQTLHELGRLPGMSHGQVRRHGEALLQAVRRGRQAEPIYPPRSPRPDEAFVLRVEALRRWRKEAALQMGVGSDVVLPRDLLFALAEGNPRGMGELAEVMAEAPWRLEHFGEQILWALGRR